MGAWSPGCGQQIDQQTRIAKQQGHPALVEQIAQRRQVEVGAGQPFAQGIAAQPVEIELGDTAEEIDQSDLSAQ